MGSVWMHSRWILAFACCASFACATNSDAVIDDDASADSTSVTYYDQYVPRDQQVATDSAILAEVIPPTDAGDLPDSPGTDSNPSGGCSPVGQPCMMDNPTCPFFYLCESATPWDAGPRDAAANDGGAEAAADSGPTDSGALDASADAADAGKYDGICLAAFPPPSNCNNGVDHCPSNGMCLMAAQRCLSPQEVACVCGNPATSPCGPP